MYQYFVGFESAVRVKFLLIKALFPAKTVRLALNLTAAGVTAWLRDAYGDYFGLHSRSKLANLNCLIFMLR